MLKRIDELLQRAERYGSDLYDLAPPQHLQHPNPDDETSMAWRRAADAAVTNYRALADLRARIAAKVERAEASANN
jgi:hypothetical protein